MDVEAMPRRELAAATNRIARAVVAVGRIQAVRVMRNPDKLSHLRARG